MPPFFSLRTCVSVLILGFLLGGCGSPAPSHPPQVGDKAPGFSLLDANGQKFSSENLQPGWWLVLVFYRGSWCGACQDWLLDLKKDIPQFTALHGALAAVSVDRVADSATFNAQWRFPFPLLSDPQHRLIDAYGFLNPKAGHQGEDISRVAVVIIDPQGVIRYLHSGKEAWDHPKNDEVLYWLKGLESGTPVPTGGMS